MASTERRSGTSSLASGTSSGGRPAGRLREFSLSRAPAQAEAEDLSSTFASGFAAALQQVASAVQEATFPEKSPLLPAPAATAAGSSRAASSSTDAKEARPAHCAPEEFGKMLQSLAAFLGPQSRISHQVPGAEEAAVEALRLTAESLVWGERHDGALFDIFCERQALEVFVNALLNPLTASPVRVQLLQTLCILMQNARRDTSFYYLLSGGHLNKLLSGQPDLSSEEALAYFAAFLKSLALRLDSETAPLLLSRKPGGVGGVVAGVSGFPLFSQAARFATHREQMVRTSARAALLSMLRLDHFAVQSAAIEAARRQLAPDLARSLRACWANASLAVWKADGDHLRAALESEEDILGHICELMQLGLPEITEALAREIIAGAVLPLLGNLAPPLQYPGHAELVAAKDDGSRGGKSADSPGLSLNAAMALRAVAACVHSLRQVGLAGLAVPLAQLLLWPAAPAALVSAIQAPQSSAAPGARDHVTAAFAAASAAAVEEDLATLRAAEPLSEQQRSRRRLTGPGLLLDAEETCSGELSVFIPNPFRAAMLGMLHRAEGEDKDNRDRERQESLRGLCPGPLLAAWAFTELWAALGGISAMEEAQLLPVSARQEPLFPEGAGFADVLSAGLSWLWAGYAGALHGTGGSPGEADDEDVPGASQDGLEEEGHSGQKDGGVGPCLHTHMVASLRARSRLPRLGHEAVAAAILELASLSASESVLQRTAQESAAWLQEASGLLCGAAAAAEAACGSQGGDAHSGFSGLHARSLSADASAPWGSGMSGLPGPTGPPASAVPAGFPTNLDRLEAATAAAEQLITAFLEEWEWHQTKMRELQAVVPEESGSRLPVELMAEVCSNDECLLTPSRNGHTAPRDAARALLSLRRLCAALVLSGPEEDASSPLAQGAGAGAFGSSSAQGELFGSGAFGSVAPKEAAQDRGQGQSHACQMMDASSCPVQAEVGSETDRDGRHGRNQSTQSISCVGPAGEQWALLLHPSALIVSSQNGESSIHADKGPSEATLCVPLWRVSARPSASDPLLLRLRICNGPQTTRQPVQRIFSNNLVANGPDHPAGAASKARAAAARGERLLSLRFLNAPARTEAFGHVRERRSLELKRLLGQIATFARQATAAASEDVQRLSGSLGGRRRQRRREEDLSCQRVGPVVHRAGQGLCGRDDYSP